MLFVDASRDLEPGTNQNRLRPADLDRIVQTYSARQTVEHYAYRATHAEIAANDYNLNIPRYGDTFQAEDAVDLKAVQAEIGALESQLTDVKARMAAYFKELELDG